MHRRPWLLHPLTDESLVDRLSHELNRLPRSLARALVVRGVHSFDDARRFFRSGLDDLHDPFLMTDMDRAADRLVAAIRSRERVVVYGDYDVDGTTSTALLTHFLRSQGVPATFFIPDRLRHGYGLCPAGIESAAEARATLIVALDCGIQAHEEANLAARLGIDLVICDHHKPSDTLPEAAAVLNPKRSDDAYPSPDLCGCGVGFKLVQAVSERLGLPPESAWPYLDLVALATVADIVPVRGENRLLVREGLARLRQGGRLGLGALADEARVSLADCTARDILFGIGPRINAAGRLGDATRAVRLMLSEEQHEAAARARQLERLNTERRALDRSTLEQAVVQADDAMRSDPAALVLYHRDWHVGVIGIVASRIVERYGRPAILLTQVGDVAKGSARSVEGVSVYAAMKACAEHLQTYGGHDMAAGLALDPTGIDAFREDFAKAVADGDHDASASAVLADARVELDDIDDRFWAVLSQFAPFGPGNEAPRFVARNLRSNGSPTRVGREGNHLKFRVVDGDRSLDAIAFSQADREDCVRAAGSGQPMDLLFAVEENVWNGKRSLQLKVQGIRSSGQSDGFAS